MALLVRTSVLSYQSTSDTQHPLWLSKLVLVSQGLEVWKLHYPDSLASRAPGSVLQMRGWCMRFGSQKKKTSHHLLLGMADPCIGR